MNRRDLIRILLASPIAATMDIERLLWMPRPIITVPIMPKVIPVIVYGDAKFVLWDGTFEDFDLLHSTVAINISPRIPPGRVFIKRVPLS